MKKCPYCAEEIQDEAIVCRYCGREMGQAAAPVVEPQPQAQARKGGIPAWVWLVLVAIIIVGVGIINGRERENQSASASPRENAFYACQEFVTRGLKAPKTAEFARYSAASVDDVGAGTFIVSSYVDAQNSFGAMIRTQYRCRVMRQDNGDWRLVDLTTD